MSYLDRSGSRRGLSGVESILRLALDLDWVDWVDWVAVSITSTLSTPSMYSAPPTALRGRLKAPAYFPKIILPTDLPPFEHHLQPIRR